MAKERGWQRKLRERTVKLSNNQLLRETLDLAGGDYYDRVRAGSSHCSTYSSGGAAREKADRYRSDPSKLDELEA